MSHSEDFRPRQRIDDGEAAGTPPPMQDDWRLIDALEEYQAALEAGRRPDRQAFLARHADTGPALARALDVLEFLRTAAP
jgi:hypothetical protein